MLWGIFSTCLLSYAPQYLLVSSFVHWSAVKMFPFVLKDNFPTLLQSLTWWEEMMVYYFLNKNEKQHFVNS